MNKEHWNTVLPDSDVPTDTFYAMIQESYDRTRPKTHRVRKETPHEWETMQRAKMYIHKLAGGIDPLTDRPLPEDTVLNQPRLARCFSYVEILIERAMQQEIRSVKARRKNLPPFFLTPEQKQKVLLVHEPIPISKFAEALNAAADLECVQKIKATDLTKWLVQKGLLQEVVRNDKRHKEPTANGRAIGITSEWREALTTGAHYLSILYRYEAQQFLLDNLDSIPAE